MPRWQKERPERLKRRRTAYRCYVLIEIQSGDAKHARRCLEGSVDGLKLLATGVAISKNGIFPTDTNEHLERLHLYLGPGKGSAYAYKHLPSGIIVGGAKPLHMK